MSFNYPYDNTKAETLFLYDMYYFFPYFPLPMFEDRAIQPFNDLYPEYVIVSWILYLDTFRT